MTQTPKPTRGRPTVLQSPQRVTVQLDAQTIERAKKLGNGNLSLGIRRAFGEIKS